MKYTIVMTPEFIDWFENETSKSQVQILDRLKNIETHGYFSDHKRIDDNVSELKWKIGRRIYYALIPEFNVLLLIGGNKNGQAKDINQAKKIYEKHTKNS